ncbi:glycosyltransferase [Micromonospora sp. CPCC 206061]|uniref:glycosyltransferase n=1 Tax=Micromonospora sp. CPCC 206061 TaxID=3122410 RepID=UPI002FF07330
MAGWTAYVTASSFPWGQAGSRRVNGMVRSLAALGHDVVVANGGNPPSGESKLADVEGPGSVSWLGLGEFSDDCPAYSVRAWLSRGRKVIEWLDAQSTKPSHVVVSGGGAQYAARLHEWCGRNRVTLIADVADWPDRRHVRGGLIGPSNMTVKAALRHYYPRFDGVIAISSFLQRFYGKRNCHVLRVPPTLDAVNASIDGPPDRVDGALSLVYFGTPGKKDLVATMIRAVDQVAREGGDLKLHIFGPSLEEVGDLIGGRQLPHAVRVMGRLAQWEVATMVGKADFSIVVRRSDRFANAGFPTKFCESLAAGTPVIANLTSDLGAYLSDGVEGIVCVDHSVDALAHALRRALRLHPDELRAMRRAARERALASFDYRNYVAELGRFLRQVQSTRSFQDRRP